jgi:hypothetical protein
MLDGLKFWKNNDDFDLDDDLPPLDDDPGQQQRQGDPQFGESKAQEMQRSQDYGQPNAEKYNNPSFNANASFEQEDTSEQSFNTRQSQGRSVHQDLEIINSKLDAIKNALESMDQRIKKIEQIADAETQQSSRDRDPWKNF